MNRLVRFSRHGVDNMQAAGQTGRRANAERRSLVSLAGSFVLILTAVFCSMGALVSAFSFSVSMDALFWFWLVTSLALASLATFLRGRGVLILAPVALALIAWKLPEIAGGAKWAVFFITGEYNKWIEIPVLFSGARPDAYAETVLIAAAGTVLAFLLTFAICLRRSAALTILFTVPPVFLTFVLTTYQPNRWYLIALLGVYLTLIISSAFYPFDFAGRGAAVFPAMALAALLLGAAYFLSLRDATRGGELVEYFDSRLRSIAAQTGFSRHNFGIGWPESGEGGWEFNTEYVRVADAGPRKITDQSMLEIVSTRAGAYYLRGYSMQFFDGRAWYGNSDALNSSDEWLSSSATASIVSLYYILEPDLSPAAANMTVTVTGDASPLIYLPYYTHSYSIVSLTDSERYSIDFVSPGVSLPAFYASMRNDLEGLAAVSLSLNIANMRQLAIRVRSTYTKVDDSTAESLRRFALDAGIDPGADRAAVADSVAELIRSSARYTLTPLPVPEGEDFALYFLSVSKQGYCIHFATAATLMLRALGIPARFTSGFVVSVPYGGVGETIVVTDAQAHAWVEVFYDDIGWIPLEVSPYGSGVPAGTSHSSANAASRPDGDDDDMFYEWPLEPDRAEPLPPTAASGAETEARDQTDPAGSGAAILLAAALLPACILVIVLRRLVVLKKRKTGFTQEDTNAAVILVWRYITRLDRKRPPPAEIEDLALKARFSNHRISEDERAAMLDHAAKLSEAMFSKYYLPGRLWLKYIRICHVMRDV